MIKYIALLLVAVLLAAVAIGSYINSSDECAGLSDSARDNCYDEHALATLDIAPCYKIQSGVFMNSCIAEIGIMKNDTGFCNKASGNAVSYCYSAISSATSDLSLCSSVQDEGWRDNCHASIAFKTKNHSLCLGISEVSHRDECLSTLAVELNESQLCSKVTENISKDRCFGTLALMQSNKSLCTQTTAQLAADVCYLRLARALNSSEYCEEIGVSSIHQDCLKIFT